MAVLTVSGRLQVGEIAVLGGRRQGAALERGGCEGKGGRLGGFEVGKLALDQTFGPGGCGKAGVGEKWTGSGSGVHISLYWDLVLQKGDLG